jgi:site-specific recombinase XerD
MESLQLAKLQSAGLRLGELLNLRVDDLHMDTGKIFIHSGKGKEDRCTILAAQMKETLVEYLRSYKPRYWLIEGRLEKKSGANRYATVHRLRPALATQLPERRNMQGVPGYASVNTTEICSPTCPALSGITSKGGNQIQSPLDHMDLGDKRNGGNGGMVSSWRQA